jgi:hypothetical protein
MMRPTLNGEPAPRRQRRLGTNEQAQLGLTAAEALARAPLAVLIVDTSGVLVWRRDAPRGDSDRLTARAREFLSSIANPCLEKPLDMSERRLVGRAALVR